MEGKDGLDRSKDEHGALLVSAPSLTLTESEIVDEDAGMTTFVENTTMPIAQAGENEGKGDGDFNTGTASSTTESLGPINDTSADRTDFKYDEILEIPGKIRQIETSVNGNSSSESSSSSTVVEIDLESYLRSGGGPRSGSFPLIEALDLGEGSGDSCTPRSRPIVSIPSSAIRDVWAENLAEEFALMREYKDKFNFIALDTEFPGIVVVPPPRPNDDRFRSGYTYDRIHLNVNKLKLIQLGLTMMDKDGNTPPGISAWQFNFHFDLREDTFAPSSISLLQDAGLKFGEHQKRGIYSRDFGLHFSASGFLMAQNISWISFHGGFDFAYLAKTVLGYKLPECTTHFFEILVRLFPKFYDVKFLMRFCPNLHGSLQHVGLLLKIDHHGIPHQAGSDSYLTGRAFFEMAKLHFKNGFEDYYGQLFGFYSDDLKIVRENVASNRRNRKHQIEKELMGFSSSETSGPMSIRSSNLQSSTSVDLGKPENQVESGNESIEG